MRYFAVVLFLALALVGQDAKPAQPATPSPCLEVYPQSPDRSITGAPPVAAPSIFAHGERFRYLESTALKVRDLKSKYKKSELETLEARGVKIVVTTDLTFPGECKSAARK